MGSVPTLPGKLTDAQTTSYWLGEIERLAPGGTPKKGHWEGAKAVKIGDDWRTTAYCDPRNSIHPSGWIGPVFVRYAKRVERLKPLRDNLPSERKKPVPRGRASLGKVRPSGYHLQPKGSRGSKAEPILASAKLPGSSIGAVYLATQKQELASDKPIVCQLEELRDQFAKNDARRQRRDVIRAALGH